jgi:uncharacterized protein
MRKLGVSIYPEKSTPEQDKRYLTIAKENGFSRVFTCLLSAEKSKDEIAKKFKDIISYGKELDMEVVLDVAPAIFDTLGISYDDLSFFAELGADGVRLDVAFDGKTEAKLSYNPYNLKIELNMSNDIDYVNNILSHQPNRHTIIGCHNFYPQRYTGLAYDYFVSCSKRFKKLGIRTAAFVSSSEGNLGPWSINDGLSTLEEHRSLPIHIQAKHLWATGLIDDVIIGNAYASDEEIIKLGKLNRYVVELEIELEDGISSSEEKIIFNEEHVRRGDITEYLVRSTEVRKTYANHPIVPLGAKKQLVGDVAIGNDTFGKYKAELQIVLKEMPEDDRKNVVAKIVPENLFLLNYIKPWTTFKFVEKEQL